MEDSSFFNNIWTRMTSIVISSVIALFLGKLGCGQFATTVTSGAAGVAAEEVFKPSPPANSRSQSEHPERNPIYQEERNSPSQPAPEYRPTTYTCSACAGSGQVQYTTTCTYCSGYGGFGCTYCFATGKYYNAYDGMYHYCNGCGGSGLLRCTGCSGTGKNYSTNYCSNCGGAGVIGN